MSQATGLQIKCVQHPCYAASGCFRPSALAQTRHQPAHRAAAPFRAPSTLAITALKYVAAASAAVVRRRRGRTSAPRTSVLQR